MATNTVNSSQNGTYSGRERRSEATGQVGAVATVSSTSDRKTRTEHIYDLQDRVKSNKRAADDGQAAIAAAVELQAAIPGHLRGWPLEIVVALALIGIVLEAIPASLFTQVFVTATSTLQLNFLTGAFTTIGALLGLFFGELLRGTREPATTHFRENILLIIVGILVVGFLVIGYELRYAFTTSGTAGTVAAISAPLEALALTAIAAIGIALTVVSSYKREGLEMFKVRSSLRSLRSKLRTNAAHLETNERDLERATNAAWNGKERRGIATPSAPEITPESDTNKVP